MLDGFGSGDHTAPPSALRSVSHALFGHPFQKEWKPFQAQASQAGQLSVPSTRLLFSRSCPGAKPGFSLFLSPLSPVPGLGLGCPFPRRTVEDTCPPTSSRSRLRSDRAPGPWPFLLTCLSTVLTGGPRTMRPASLRAGTLPRGLRHTGIWTVSGHLPAVVYSRSLKAIVVYIQDANSSVS